MTTKYAWSRDGERYAGGFDSIESAFADAEACNVVAPYIGALEPPKPGESYIDAALVIDHITEQDDYPPDLADGWPHASSEQLDELTEALRWVIGEWLDRHKLRETFFLVPDARQYVREDGNIVEWKGGDRHG